MALTFEYEQLPSRIIFGPGAVAQVLGEVTRLGAERVLVITGGSARRVARTVIDHLGTRVVAAVFEVVQHVPERLAMAALHCARDVGADALVAVGGGSATGLAKAVAVDAQVSIVAVPTTYAGSEMTQVYGITGAHKVTRADPYARPRAVIYDPTVTVDLPPYVTATSGFNALAHCVEACYAPRANPVSSLFALEGLRVLARALPDAVRRPQDLGARSDALYGAYLAGLALNAGSGLHHRLCHIIGGDFRVRHADVHAVLLPHVVAFNTPAIPETMRRIGAAIGADDAAAGFADLADQVGAPRGLAEIGVPEDGLHDVAKRAAADAGANPRPLNAAAVRDLLARAYRPVAPSITTS